MIVRKANTVPKIIHAQPDDPHADFLAPVWLAHDKSYELTPALFFYKHSTFTCCLVLRAFSPHIYFSLQ